MNIYYAIGCTLVGFFAGALAVAFCFVTSRDTLGETEHISDQGRKVIDDAELANKVIKAIQENGELLERGESISIEGSNMTVRFTTRTKK